MPTDHAPTRLLAEIRAALVARDDTTIMDIEEGLQPLAEQPDYHEAFSIAHVVPALGPPAEGSLPLQADIGHLIVLFLTELRKRNITPSLTRFRSFELALDDQTKAWRLPLPSVFFHTMGYPLAISIDVPEAADIFTIATLTISLNVDSDCL